MGVCAGGNKRIFKTKELIYNIDVCGNILPDAGLNRPDCELVTDAQALSV